MDAVAPARSRPHEELLGLLDHQQAQACAGSAEMLETIAELDEQEGIDDPNIPDLASHLAARYRVSSNTASEWVRVGKALRDLPWIRSAHASGRLSWDQVRILTRFVTTETDREWSHRAQEMRPHRLNLEASRQFRERQRDQMASDHAMRSLRTHWDDDRRFLHLEGCLAAEQGAVVEAALHRGAQQVELEDGELWDRRGARLADALEALLTQRTGGGTGDSTVVVHVDAKVLAGTGSGLAETSSGVQLSEEAVRRLACHAKVRWVKEQDGQPVAIGRSGRAMGGALQDLVLFRDRTCRYPGCDRTWFLHVHHIRHWARGGRTTIVNLVTLCGGHHRKMHEGGWTIRGDPNKTLSFYDREGRLLGTSEAIQRKARAP